MCGFIPPIFEELGNRFFRVTVRNREFPGQEHLTEAQKELLRYVRKNGSITTDEFMELASLPRTTALDNIRALTEAGLLKKVGRTKGVKYILVNN